jgi:chaperone BCS1
MFGALLTYIRNIPYTLWAMFLRNFTNEVSFINTDPCFEWVERWFSVNYRPNYGRYMVVSDVQDETISGRTKTRDYYLAPNYGWYFKFYRYRIVFITKVSDKATEKGDKIRDRINIRIFGSKKSLQKFLDDIHKAFFLAKNNGVIIKTLSMYLDWETRSFRYYANKPILANHAYERIKEDMSIFYSSYDSYKNKGILYKRGYLFYGEPGTGKTTAIVSLAHELKKDIYIMYLQPGMSNSGFISAVSMIPDNGILVIEDADCFQETHQRKEDSKNKETLSLSTILNTLDGVCTPMGLVFIITTNKKDTLDPALIRPGRIDMAVEFKKPEKEQIYELYTRIIGNDNKFEEFFNHNPNIGMAEAQALLLEKASN